MKPVLNGTDSNPATYALIVKILERKSRGFVVLFFLKSFLKLVFCVFRHFWAQSPLPIKTNFWERCCFGYRQDTKMADHADRKPLFGANCLFCNKGIWVEKAFFRLFPILLLAFFPAKALAFGVSKCCLKIHNA